MKPEREPAPTEESVREEVKRLCPWADEATTRDWGGDVKPEKRWEIGATSKTNAAYAVGPTLAEALDRFRSTFGRSIAAREPVAPSREEVAAAVRAVAEEEGASATEWCEDDERLKNKITDRVLALFARSAEEAAKDSGDSGRAGTGEMSAAVKGAGSGDRPVTGDGPRPAPECQCWNIEHVHPSAPSVAPDAPRWQVVNGSDIRDTHTRTEFITGGASAARVLTDTLNEYEARGRAGAPLTDAEWNAYAEGAGIAPDAPDFYQWAESLVGPLDMGHLIAAFDRGRASAPQPQGWEGPLADRLERRAPQGEPVAWMVQIEGNDSFIEGDENDAKAVQCGFHHYGHVTHVVPLYASPVPQGSNLSALLRECEDDRQRLTGDGATERDELGTRIESALASAPQGDGVRVWAVVRADGTGGVMDCDEDRTVLERAWPGKSYRVIECAPVATGAGRRAATRPEDCYVGNKSHDALAPGQKCEHCTFVAPKEDLEPKINKLWESCSSWVGADHEGWCKAQFRAFAADLLGKEDL